MSTDRTTLRLNDKRKRKIERAKSIVAADDYDDPPMSDVIDAALEHLIQSHENIQRAREENTLEEIPLESVRELTNTPVLKLTYRTDIDSDWR